MSGVAADRRWARDRGGRGGEAPREWGRPRVAAAGGRPTLEAGGSKVGGGGGRRKTTSTRRCANQRVERKIGGTLATSM